MGSKVSRIFSNIPQTDLFRFAKMAVEILSQWYNASWYDASMQGKYDFLMNLNRWSAYMQVKMTVKQVRCALSFREYRIECKKYDAIISLK